MPNNTINHAPVDLSEFQSRGYTRINAIMGKEEICLLNRALDNANAKQDEIWGDSPYYIDKGMVHNPMCYDPIFYKVLQNPVIDQYLEKILDPYYILYAFTTSSMPPSSSNFSNRIHVDCPRVINGYPTNIGVLIALDDFTSENGAPYFLPDSNRQIDQPDEKSFFENAERLYLSAGDCVIFDARTWHCGGYNSTNNFRHGISINICRSFMKQRFDYPRLLGKDLLKTMDEKTLRILGYRTRLPSSLEEYYVSPEHRLYWPNQG